MADLWYEITDTHPAPLVQVRGIVGYTTHDAHLIVSRGKPPHTSSWADWTSRKAIPLPAGVIPRLWQPQLPAKWQAPLPHPALAAETRMWSSTLKSAAVDDAEAAEIAREMERDRDDAKHGRTRGPIEKEGPSWWRDATQIRYEPPGQVTRRMAEGRIMRAVYQCGYADSISVPQASFAGVLARMMMPSPPPEDYALSDYIPRIQMAPADNADWPEAMRWFAGLNPDAASTKTWSFNAIQMLIYYRALNVPIGFHDLARKYNVSKQAVQKRLETAMCRVVESANAPVASAQIEALKERNRLAKMVA